MGRVAGRDDVRKGERGDQEEGIDFGESMARQGVSNVIESTRDVMKSERELREDDHPTSQAAREFSAVFESELQGTEV